MDWLVWVLLESRAALGALLGVVLFGLLVHWRRSGRPRALVIGLAAAAALLVAQALVVTKREHAARILTVIERDIIASRTADLADTLSDDFDFPGGRADFLEFVDLQLARVDVRYLERWGLRVVHNGGAQFTAAVEYTADVGGVYAGSFFSGWELTFIRTPAGWRVLRVRPRHLAGLHDVDWPSLRRL